MNNCKLMETLVKCDCKISEKYMPKSYICDSKCQFFQKCFYDVDCNPKNPRLENIIGGWQKYLRYTINDKDCSYINSKILNILHLINPGKIDDIVIFRVAKKNKDSEGYVVRYICRQSNKEHLCLNLTDLNNYIEKKFQYCGRKLEKNDFTGE